jgi:hypothetical protein
MRNRVYEFSRLLVALAVLGAGVAHADSCVTYSIPMQPSGSVSGPDPGALSLQRAANYISYNNSLGQHWTTATVTVSSGAYPNSVSYTLSACGSGCGTTITATPATATCPACPAAGTNTLYGLDTVDISGSTTCHSGCQYTTPAPSLQIKCSATSGACSSTSGVVESQATGYGCGSTSNSGSTAPTVDTTNPLPGQCDASGSVCADNTDGKNCGTYNGDEVCVNTIKSGTCVSYASGGVACASSSTPPVPNNGTPGTPAVAAMQVSANGQTVNYYTSTQVSSSSTTTTTTNPVQSQPTGTQGLGGSGGGTGGSVTVSGTVAVAGTVGVTADPAKGDCGATGVNCSGDATTPTLPSADTIATTTTNYVGALSSVPIVAAVSSISASIPTGTCPTGSFSVYGSTYTIDAQCSLWASVATIVQLVMLAVWALAGVRILMSA